MADELAGPAFAHAMRLIANENSRLQGRIIDWAGEAQR